MTENKLGTILNGRYRLDAKIGQGGMGTVYRAFDETLEREVALKILSQSKLGTEGRSRLLAEAKTVAKLNHPNIVAVYDAGEHEKDPYIVMEVVEGETLYEKKPVEMDEIISVAKQICLALDHAHTKSVIHRDLKPENVLIDKNGLAKLVDFGLARSVSSRLTSDGLIVGSVFYLAPEQVMGDSFDHRVDLYALGIILYELLTGSLPFEAEDPVAVISQHLHAPLVPPIAKDADIPEFLNNMIVKLLSKDPDERFTDAASVINVLENPDRSEHTGNGELSVLDRIVRGRLIGRVGEIQQARKLWAETQSEKGQLLLISGEPGIGKTRLVREISTHVEVTGGTALMGTCYAEGGMPYAPFRQILRQAFRGKYIQDLDIPEVVLQVLVKLVPELSTRYPDLQLSESLDPQAEQQRLFEYITIFFNLVSEQGPLLLVLEDSHWADSGTLYMLRYIGRETQQEAVMIAATYREVELHENRFFAQVLLDFNRERLGERLKLSRLDRNQTHNLLTALFDDELSPEFFESIYKETEGNPFFIEEVCKALVESGKMTFEEGVWYRPSIEELGIPGYIPQSVHVALQARLDRLDDQSQEVLRQAAILGRQFEYQLLSKAADLDEEILSVVLENAERAQLIEDTRQDGMTAFAFSHALIPTTLVEDTSTLPRRRLHRRAARAIESLHPDDIEALAFHYNEAGETEKAIDYLIQVADRARLLYSHQEAINNYRQVLGVFKEKEDFEQAARIQMKLALTYQNTFDFKAANQATQESFRLWRQAGEQQVDTDLSPAPHAFRFTYVEPPTIDPAMVWDVSAALVVSHLFSGLVELSPQGDILPDVARIWKISEDGRKYVFHLREDMYWSDGVQVTANDFEYAFKRVLDPVTNAANANLLKVIQNANPFHNGEMRDSSQLGVAATDELVLEINLEEPTSYFMQLLATSKTLPIPRHVLEKHGAAWTDVDKIVTNGPFHLVSWEKGERIVLKRNSTYVGRFPGNLESIEMHFSDTENMLQDYLDGRADLLELWLTDHPPKEINNIRQRHSDEYITAPGLGSMFVIFDVSQPPFDDRRVRQAFALALDKEAIAGEAYSGLVDPATGGLVPPGIPGHVADIGAVYDTEKARKLLAAAGYPLGKGFPKINAISNKLIGFTSVDKYLQTQWREVLGIRITWTKKSWDEYLEIARTDSANIWLGGWQASVRDPHYFLGQSEWNLMARWQPATYAKLLDKAVQSLDQYDRLQLYNKVENVLAADIPIIPLVYVRSHNLVKPWLKKIPLGPFWVFFKDVILEEH